MERANKAERSNLREISGFSGDFKPRRLISIQDPKNGGRKK